MKKVAGMFLLKKLQKTNQKQFRIGKVIKKINYMSRGKVMIICLIAGQIKKDIVTENELIL